MSKAANYQTFLNEASQYGHGDNKLSAPLKVYVSSDRMTVPYLVQLFCYRRLSDRSNDRPSLIIITPSQLNPNPGILGSLRLCGNAVVIV